MAKSSISIELSTIFAFLHNNREAIVTYLIDDKSRNDYDRTTGEAFNYYMKLLKEATANYTKRTRQRIQTDKKKYLWEAIVNLNEDHTLEDLEKLAVVLEKKYGWRSVQNTIHRDEGHIDAKSGNKVYNYHGHIVLFMLDENGIYRFKKGRYGIKKMEELQTLNAQVLNMERGISKKITKRERMGHYQYRQYIRKITKMEMKLEKQKSKLDELTEKILKIQKNKKKTAFEIRKKTRVSNNDEWQKLKLFCMDSKNELFADLSGFPSPLTGEVSDVDLILEWMKAAQMKILSLEEEHTLDSSMVVDLDVDCSQEVEDYVENFNEDVSDELDFENIDEKDDDVTIAKYNEKLCMIDTEDESEESHELPDSDCVDSLEVDTETNVDNVDSNDDTDAVVEVNSEKEYEIEDETAGMKMEEIETSEEINDNNPIESEDEKDQDVNEIQSCSVEELEGMSVEELLSTLDKNDPLLESIKVSLGEEEFEELYQSIMESTQDPTLSNSEKDKDSSKDIIKNITNNINP